MTVKVHVRNFQSLKDTELEISGFTAITGPNNSGKSALMRAIRGVFQNTPGTSFVRHGADEMSVSLDFDDGRTVVWKKGITSRSKPTYIVDGGSPIYPGRGVPEEVRALGVTPISVMGREVWPTLAPQFTGQVFLLDQPGSVLAEAVADVARVSKLNGALRASDKELRRATGRLKVRREDHVVLTEELQTYDGLDVLLTQIEAIELDRTKALKLERVVDTLRAYQQRLGASREDVVYLSRVEEIVVPEVKEAVSKVGGLEVLARLRRRFLDARGEVSSLEGVGDVEVPGTVTSEVRGLLDQLSMLDRLKPKYESACAEFRSLSGVDRFEEVEFDKVKATKTITALEFLQKVRVRLLAVRQREAGLESELKTVNAEAASLEEEVLGLLGQFEECPTCGQLMGHSG